MSTIVLHAGMQKAGSSSIQLWLRREIDRLREQGFVVVVAPPDERGAIELVPCEGGGVNSSWLVRGTGKDRSEQERRVEALFEALNAATDRYGDLIVSAEGFAHPFFRLNERFLAGLQRLSASHEIRVAYYARPQHTALEAAWRQWGYRSGVAPSEFVRERAAFFHYAATRAGVRRLAPGIDFEPSPFSPDALTGGDIVVDFAARFLGVETEGGIWENRGLPLAVVNALAAAPPGMFWDPSYDNARVDRIKRLLNGHRPPDEERIALSRKVLRRYAHERYAAENAELGWGDFVPPLPDEEEEDVPGIEALDSLWRPQASATELAVLFRALHAAIGANAG